jgi:hypothetical protein
MNGLKRPNSAQAESVRSKSTGIGDSSDPVRFKIHHHALSNDSRRLTGLHRNVV